MHIIRSTTKPCQVKTHTSEAARSGSRRRFPEERVPNLNKWKTKHIGGHLEILKRLYATFRQNANRQTLEIVEKKTPSPSAHTTRTHTHTRARTHTQTRPHVRWTMKDGEEDLRPGHIKN